MNVQMARLGIGYWSAPKEDGRTSGSKVGLVAMVERLLKKKKQKIIVY